MRLYAVWNDSTHWPLNKEELEKRSDRVESLERGCCTYNLQNIDILRRWHTTVDWL